VRERNILVFDCEVYKNFFLVAFKTIDKTKSTTIKITSSDSKLSDGDRTKLVRILKKYEVVGFNSQSYDIPIILRALNSATAYEIYLMSKFIIESGSNWWATYKHFNINVPNFIQHIDIKNPCPAIKVGLKLLGARMHAPKLQELPIDPDSLLTESDMLEIEKYCFNDVNITIMLYEKIKERVDLRRILSNKYSIDLKSKSDAQIAETVIKNELGIKYIEIPKVKTVTYNAPEFIKFKSEKLNGLLHSLENHCFEIDTKGYVKLPDSLCLKTRVGQSEYQLGLGGLHSIEHSRKVTADEDYLLIDKDVASYYPAIILKLKLYPPQLGSRFLGVYKKIVDERLAAKKAGNKVINESLKIVINGSFGKLGSKYSCMYSPELLLRVTLTGQLSLLMLIEALESKGIEVVSANTDGFVSKIPREKLQLYQAICKKLESQTDFTLEDTHYKTMCSRDVNNYIALAIDNKFKKKGIFAPDDADEQLKKNPTSRILTTAIENYILSNTDIKTTIKSCRDVTQFIQVRTVNGGAMYQGKYLGRVVRWIYSTKSNDFIYYKKPNKKGNHNKVPKSDNSRPIMDFDGFPDDIDYQRYIDETYKTMKEIGL
jgi:hypothetical protein